MSVYSVDKLVEETRRLASEFRRAGKPFPGASVLIAEYDAARYLDLDLLPEPRTGGFDAVGRGSREGKRIQIKGRTIFDEGKKTQRIGQLKTEQDWDSVVLVLMDENHEAYEIYEADRAELLDELKKNASKRSKRGAMSVAKFKIIGRLVWARNEGEVEEIWENKASR